MKTILQRYSPSSQFRIQQECNPDLYESFSPKQQQLKQQKHINVKRVFSATNFAKTPSAKNTLNNPQTENKYKIDKQANIKSNHLSKAIEQTKNYNNNENNILQTNFQKINFIQTPPKIKLKIPKNVNTQQSQNDKNQQNFKADSISKTNYLQTKPSKSSDKNTNITASHSKYKSIQLSKIMFKKNISQKRQYDSLNINKIIRHFQTQKQNLTHKNPFHMKKQLVKQCLRSHSQTKNTNKNFIIKQSPTKSHHKSVQSVQKARQILMRKIHSINKLQQYVLVVDKTSKPQMNTLKQLMDRRLFCQQNTFNKRRECKKSNNIKHDRNNDREQLKQQQNGINRIIVKNENQSNPEQIVTQLDLNKWFVYHGMNQIHTKWGKQEGDQRIMDKSSRKINKARKTILVA